MSANLVTITKNPTNCYCDINRQRRLFKIHWKDYLQPRCQSTSFISILKHSVPIMLVGLHFTIFHLCGDVVFRLKLFRASQLTNWENGVVLALYWNRKWCGSISSRTKIFTLIFILNLKTKKHWKKMKEIRLMNKEVKTVWSSVTFATRVVFWCLIPSYLVSSPSRLRISKSNKGKKTTQNIVLCNCFQ